MKRLGWILALCLGGGGLYYFASPIFGRCTAWCNGGVW